MRFVRATLGMGLGALVALGCGDEGDDEDLDVDIGSASSCGASEARAENVDRPTTVIGNGSAASCTSEKLVAAVKKGGVIKFNCGARSHVIKLKQTAKVFNNAANKRIVIDGGGKITLSGDGKRRILYMNTCDPAQVWTTSHCDNQEYPQLTVQNLTFVDGNAKNEAEKSGGAIYAQGGRLKVINSRFYRNTCADTGPDVGGGAIRALQQWQGRPVYIVGSTFGESAKPNVCSNGGALSTIGASFSVYNSVFTGNRAVGRGANPAQPGTPGGGSGGAIYNDGNRYTLDLCGVTMTGNRANEGGGGVFFVSNDRTGTMRIRDSRLSNNLSGKFETEPGIFLIGHREVSNSQIKR